MSLFPWQRGRAQLLMLGALAVLVALVTATFIASAAFVERRSAEIADAELDRASAGRGALVVQTRLAEESAEQDAAWEGLVAGTRAGDALEVARLLITEPLTLTVEGPGAPDGDPDSSAPGVTSRTSLAVVDWLPEHADLTAGDWPGGAAVEDGRIAGVLPLSSAQELGVDVGDVLLLGLQRDTVVEVVGTWEPREPAAPRWFGFGSVDLTGSATAIGPVVVAALDVDATDPFVRWSLIPTAHPGTDPAPDGALDVPALSALAAGVGSLADRAAGEETLAPRGVTSTGDLPGTLADLVAAGRAAALVGDVALALLVVIGIATVTQVARLVAQTRAAETAILVARGASPRWLAALTWGEAAVVALAGTGLGLVTGDLLGGRSAGGLLPAVLGLLLWTGAIALPGWMLTRSLVHGARPDSSGRARSLATGGAALLLLLAAGLSLWRFNGRGETRTGVDQAVAIGAPGLVVLALAVVALVALAPVWGALERTASRVDGTAPRLALLAVTRRRAVLGVPLLLVVVAVATAVLGAAYSGSTLAAQRQLDDTRVGAGARLELPGRSALSVQFPPRDLSPVLAIDDVEAAALVTRVQARAGQQDLVLEAVASSAVEPVLSGGTLPLPDLAAVISSTPGHPVPPGPVTASVLAQQAESVYVGEILEVEAIGVLWLQDAGGALARVDLAGGPLPLGQPTRLAGEVPEGDWDLLALDVQADGVVEGWESTLEITLTGLVTADDAGGQSDGATLDDPVLDDDWATRAWPAAGEGAVADPAGAGAGTRTGRTAAAGLQESALLRFVPQPTGAVPAVVTRALADRLDLDPGAALTVGYRGITVAVEVDAVTDLVPGLLDEPAVLVDLTALQRAEVLQRRAVADATEIWVATGSGGTPSAPTVAALQTLARAQGGTLVTADADSGTGTAVAQPVFVGVGLVAILLAVVGTLAAFDVLARSRRGEVITLRAIGVPGRVQGRSRFLEAAVLALVAVPTGAVVGWLVSLLTIGTLVRLSIPGLAALEPPLRLAGPELGISLLLALAGVAAVGAGVGRQVRRQHADTDHREETR